jgi:hypothetical protein
MVGAGGAIGGIGGAGAIGGMGGGVPPARVVIPLIGGGAVIILL